MHAGSHDDDRFRQGAHALPSGGALGRPPGRVIVLAAGAGRRMRRDADAGAPKLAREVLGTPVLGWTLRFVRDALVRHHAGCETCAAGAAQRPIVVLAPRSPLVDIVAAHDGAQVTADAADRGLAWSLRAGIDAALADDQGVVVVLGDDPLAAASLGGVLVAACAHPGRAAVVDRDGGTPHPVYLPRSLVRAFHPPASPHGADRGLRELVEAATPMLVPPAGGPDPVDVDEPADLDALAAALTLCP